MPLRRDSQRLGVGSVRLSKTFLARTDGRRSFVCISRLSTVIILIPAARSRLWRLDLLMNNAGIMLYKNLRAPATNLAELMAEVNINVGGVIAMTSAFIDILTANKGTVINVSSALAFVPLPAAPIYSATKAAIHSYTQSLRFQLEDSGVEVIELMPPGVKTDLTAELGEDTISLISTDDLVKQSFASLKAGALEIRPGQSKTLARMRRLAPDFINGQLWKASKKLVPIAVGRAG